MIIKVSTIHLSFSVVSMFINLLHHMKNKKFNFHFKNIYSQLKKKRKNYCLLTNLHPTKSTNVFFSRKVEVVEEKLNLQLGVWHVESQLVTLGCAPRPPPHPPSPPPCSFPAPPCCSPAAPQLLLLLLRCSFCSFIFCNLTSAVKCPLQLQLL